MPETTIQALDQALTNHPFRPKGIMTGVGLFDALKANGRIQRKDGLWYLDDDIFISIDNESDQWSYDIPSQP